MLPVNNTPTMGKFSWKEKESKKKVLAAAPVITARPISPAIHPTTVMANAAASSNPVTSEMGTEDGEGMESVTSSLLGSETDPSDLRRSRRLLDDNEVDAMDSQSETTMTASGTIKRVRIHGGGMHRCDRCGKVYKHKNCLVKHRWEHHDSWPMTKNWCQTKHQQVQMLEAAHVLVDIIGGDSFVNANGNVNGGDGTGGGEEKSRAIARKGSTTSAM